jgi:hypothetical protein
MSQKTRGLVLAVAVMAVGCDALSKKLDPAKANPVAPAPVPVVVQVVAVPTPTPAPEPAATPAPDPAPTTAPAPPAAKSCSLPAGTGSGTNCPRQSPSYLKEVESAMDQLYREEPDIFDKKRSRGCGECYFLKDPDRFSQRMAELMSQRGLCGHYDGEELAVKGTNSFNDQYDIVTSDMFVRRQLGSYRSTCYPAWF